jgi:hypothetical protein
MHKFLTKMRRASRLWAIFSHSHPVTLAAAVSAEYPTIWSITFSILSQKFLFLHPRTIGAAVSE